MENYQDIFEDNQEFLNNRTGRNLQGNIIQSHGRKHVAFLTLHWDDDDTQASRSLKKYLSILADPPANNPDRISISTAARENKTRKTYGKASTSPELFIGIYLTYQGFEFFEKENEYKEIYDHLKDRDLRADMQDKGGWETRMKNIPQMMLMMAHSSENFVKQRAAYFLNIFKQRFEALESSFVEYGKVYHNRFGKPVEHFGFADGYSQPWFLPKPGRILPSAGQWNPVRDVREFLVEESVTGRKCFGSFLAYRKFEQHVEAFAAEQIVQAEQLGVSPALAGAKMVGRFTEGSPLALYDAATTTKKSLDGRELNFFNYNNDTEGNKCPFSAHIRKMNNRTDSDGPMIIRRGVTYGERRLKTNGEFDSQNFPSKDVGLHFLSFQKSLATFKNLLPKPNGDTAHDAILGDLKSGLVQMKGGSNYYAPSIEFFRKLK
ncbi:MAG: hypothetical protein AAFZ15_06975 [Bacteroidota bacterium]